MATMTWNGADGCGRLRFVAATATAITLTVTATVTVTASVGASDTASVILPPHLHTRTQGRRPWQCVFGGACHRIVKRSREAEGP